MKYLFNIGSLDIETRATIALILALVAFILLFVTLFVFKVKLF